MRNRNEARWVDQEKGLLNYDQKNIMHCFRLLYSGINILENGEPIVRFREDLLKFLMEIRSGKYEYEFLMDKVSGLQVRMDEALHNTSIPEEVDNDKIEGLYYHIMGESNKGKAVQKLIELFAKEFTNIKTIGLGDGWNDLPMLNVVDMPVLVQKQIGKYVELADLTEDQRQEIGIDALGPDFFAKLYKADGVGPEGWSKALEALIRD